MQPNPYAPPKAEVADVANVSGETAPPLWNPGAAAGWSVLFSPAFGAYLHMKNWRSLGEPAKAATARGWIVATIVVLALFSIVSAFFPESKALDGVSRVVGLALLLSWYFSQGKAQVVWVKSRFGKSYPRRGWATPLLIGVVALVAFFAVIVAVAFVAAMVVPQA